MLQNTRLYQNQLGPLEAFNNKRQAMHAEVMVFLSAGT